jgi:hypothetical protein
MSDHPAALLRIARRLVAVLPLFAALSCCAPPPGPETGQVAGANMPENPVCRPDPALLTPQSAPDCKFGRPELKTVDPDQWARLNVEFERQCYQRAERTVRERLRLLQASARCENGAGRR